MLAGWFLLLINFNAMRCSEHCIIYVFIRPWGNVYRSGVWYSGGFATPLLCLADWRTSIESGIALYYGKVSAASCILVELWFGGATTGGNANLPFNRAPVNKYRSFAYESSY